jgi:TraE protein
MKWNVFADQLADARMKTLVFAGLAIVLALALLANGLFRGGTVVVMVPPEVDRSMWAAGNTASPEYMTKVAMPLIAYLANVHPESVDLSFKTFMGLVAPESAGVIQERLNADKSYILDRQMSRVFYPMQTQPSPRAPVAERNGTAPGSGSPKPMRSMRSAWGRWMPSQDGCSRLLPSKPQAAGRINGRVSPRTGFLVVCLCAAKRCRAFELGISSVRWCRAAVTKGRIPVGWPCAPAAISISKPPAADFKVSPIATVECSCRPTAMSIATLFPQQTRLLPGLKAEVFGARSKKHDDDTNGAARAETAIEWTGAAAGSPPAPESARAH